MARRLPEAVAAVLDDWSLSLPARLDSSEVSFAWVAPVTRADGTRVVLKLGLPHMEGEHEIQGLASGMETPRCACSTPTRLNAMLLERCEPGTVLRARPEPEQDA